MNHVGFVRNLALAAITMTLVTAGLVDVLGRIIAPQLASSLALLLLVIALLALLGIGLALAAGIVNISLFALLITGLYLRLGAPEVSKSTVTQNGVPTSS